LKAAPGLALACCVTLALAQPKSDWERQNEARVAGEEPVVLPATPNEDALVEIYVSADTELRYFVDTASVSVGRDRVVRYTLVARSPSGAENVTYEGIRCPGEHRVYAVGRPDGTWGGRPSGWREIVRGTTRGWPYALARHYFCPHRDPIFSAAEGVNALRRGSHPAVEVDTTPMPSGTN
jgi:hypothetical protein